jgi:hypothetical protein
MMDKMNPISLFDEFRKIIDILTIIQNKIDSDTDVVWTGFNTPQELKIYLVSHIEKLRLCDYETLAIINMNFCPTGTYQELAISNGWGDEYLELANQFDEAHKKLLRI